MQKLNQLIEVMNNDIRTIALTNIMAAQKVIQYNQQFLRPEDIPDAERRLSEIEQRVRGAIADCEEMKNRWIEFREKERPDSLERNRYNRDIYDYEKKLEAYNHCLRIITGEQKLIEERMFNYGHRK